MTTKVLPEHCFLLSNERVRAFQESCIQATENEISNYIRDILPGGNLSDLANETGIDISVVVALSNYTNTYKELKTQLNSIHETQSNYMRYYPADFLSFISSHSATSISELVLAFKIDQIQKRNMHTEQMRLKRYGTYFEYFGLENTDASEQLIKNAGIDNTMWDQELIIDFFTHYGFSKIDDIEWTKQTSTLFLKWFISKNPDAKPLPPLSGIVYGLSPFDLQEIYKGINSV